MMGERFRTNLTQIESNTGATEETTVSHMAVADDFPTVMGMEVVIGRDFSSDFGTDETAAIIVNETLVAQRGWIEPLGKRLLLDERPRRVIGVVRDFHYRSLHEAVEPFVMYQFNDDFEAFRRKLARCKRACWSSISRATTSAAQSTSSGTRSRGSTRGIRSSIDSSTSRSICCTCRSSG